MPRPTKVQCETAPESSTVARQSPATNGTVAYPLSRKHIAKLDWRPIYDIHENVNKIEHERLPPWLKKAPSRPSSRHSLKSSLRASGLHTVCEEARCPNIDECFSRRTATFMILGNACTRICKFCNVRHGAQPQAADPEEPKDIARHVKDLGLAHAVITSVTRDDLPDGGAAHFAATVEEVRDKNPRTTIEVLVPDFGGRPADIVTVIDARPHVFDHNIETVERLTPAIRDKRASYKRSLEVLRIAKGQMKRGFTKSGLMLGLGEERADVLKALRDLADVGCDIVTIGQYLRPSRSCVRVAQYIDPDIFLEYEGMREEFGFKYLFAGPFVRSSYLADKVLLEIGDDNSCANASSTSSPGRPQGTQGR
jgi:lipoic acid synthetase